MGTGRPLGSTTESCPSTQSSYRAKRRLEKHYSNIESHRRKFQRRKLSAQVTEAKGERAAARYMERHHPDFEMVSGFGMGTGFDQVWVKKDKNGKVEEFMIVEAKGPDAPLKKGYKKGDQMSKKWVKNSIQEMRSSGDKEERALGNSLHKAMNSKSGRPKVTGKAIQAVAGSDKANELKLPGGGTYKRYN